MRPESTSIMLRNDLAALLPEYDDLLAAQNFIGLAIAPVFEVGEQAAAFPIFNRESFKKPAATARAEGGAYNRITGEFGSGNYSCDESGLEYPIDDRRRKRYARFIDAEQAATRILRFQMRLRHERAIAALTLANGSFTQNAPSVVWSTAASAVPLNDLQTGIETLEDKCGVDRSLLTLIMPRADSKEFCATTQVVDKSKYTYPGIQPAQLQAAQIASMLGIGRCLLPRSVYDANEEGVTETNTQVWTAGVVMLCVAAAPNAPLDTPSIARTFLWTGDSPSLAVVESYRDESRRSDIVRIRENTDEALTGELNLFGYALTT